MWGKICTWKRRTSQRLSCQLVFFFYFRYVLSTQPHFLSPEGVSFKNFSSISRTWLYWNAITQAIKGTSIICNAHLFPLKALKACNLKQTTDVTVFLIYEGMYTVYNIVMKSFFGSWVKRASIYISLWQLYFVSTDYWMDGASLNKANSQPV